MNKNFFKAFAIFVIGVVIGLLLNQNGNVLGFGFEKNTSVRKSADAEGVLGCMESCQGMLSGLQDMKTDSKNYQNQKEKIEAKSEQCLAMNNLAGSPYTEEQILTSCGISFEPPVPPTPTCSSNADCPDDGNPCTRNFCDVLADPARCKVENEPNGFGCLLPGGISGTCISGQCIEEKQ